MTEPVPVPVTEPVTKIVQHLPVTSAYIHIPFCRRRCYYCDFAVSVVGDRLRGDTSNTISRYITTLIREINATPRLNSVPLRTVFFGGGTPSLLSVAQLEAILQAVAHRFEIDSNAEISMEMDPATFDIEHIRGYKKAGINRVSLGAQDFEDDVLAASGRFHRRGDIFNAIELIHQANIDNFSLDLISGLPHQTLESWHTSLETALELQPQHLSQYDLIVEPQTAFARYYSPGELPLPSDEHTAQMYRMAQSQLVGNGYEHYEICNYALKGYEAQHNLTYWKNQPCYGFGMGATSYLPVIERSETGGYQRIDRPRTQRSYRTWVDAFERRGGHTDDPVLLPTERVLEEIMVGLRLAEGISLVEIFEVYGEAGLRAMGEAIAPHINSGWVVADTAVADTIKTPNVTNLEPTCRIWLTDPEGFLMSNVVIVDAFNALEALGIKEIQ